MVKSQKILKGNHKVLKGTDNIMVKSYKIIKGQSEDIKRDRQYNCQKLEDTKGVIRRNKKGQTI